jgi:hypothetical protein
LGGAVDVDGGNANDVRYPGDLSWESPLLPGTANATYIEDNHFDYTPGVVLDGAYDSYAGARLVFRFNTVKSTNMGGHGLDSGGLRSTLQQEVYRNTLTNLGSSVYTWFQTRGGLHLIFDNTISGSGGSYNDYMWISNYRSSCDTGECGTWGNCDGTSIQDQNLPGQQGYFCRDQVGRGPTTNPSGDWPRNSSTPIFAQASFPAYSWNNTYKGAVPTITSVQVSGYNSNTRAQTFHLLNNRDFYMEVPNFTGASGTGSGTLASRPATCTTGVGYWATDQGSWNTQGASGVFYKCTSTNTWTLYYTPYTYPHPLQIQTAQVQGQGDVTPPAAPANLAVR